MTYLLRNISDDLWKKFKLICVEKEVSIRANIQELIEIEVEKGEAKAEEKRKRIRGK